jgi:hypothetical protein
MRELRVRPGDRSSCRVLSESDVLGKFEASVTRPRNQALACCRWTSWSAIVVKSEVRVLVADGQDMPDLTT